MRGSTAVTPMERRMIYRCFADRTNNDKRHIDGEDKDVFSVRKEDAPRIQRD